MRAVAVALVVVASALGLSAPTIALPPEDLAAYCRAVYPQVPFQIRCMSLERASQERIAAARSAVDQTAWDRCHSGSASWSAMENCLAQPATASAPAPGAVVPPAGGGASEPADDRSEPADDRAEARRPGGEEGGAPAPGEARTAPGAPVAAQPPAAIVSGSGSTIILGPQVNPALTAPPDNRPSRPVSEAEADRQLRNILELTGETSARCTKRQYGPGWVIVCD
jgi:hypothetical protein